MVAISPKPFLSSLFLLSCIAGCGSESPPSEQNDAAVMDGQSSPDATLVPSTCPVNMGPDDKTRFVVAAHPYDSNGQKYEGYEVWTLSETGQLTYGGERFEMGRSFSGSIAFRVDGTIGATAHDDGSIGIFSLDDNGRPRVIHKSYEGDFRAHQVTFNPNHPDELWVIDDRWAEYGGGIYRLRLDCEGAIQDETRISESKLMKGLAWLDDETLVIAATELGRSGANNDIHKARIDSESITEFASQGVFSDEAPIVSSLMLTGDKRYALISSSNNIFGVPDNIGVVSMADGGLQVVQTIDSVESPTGLLMSPYNNLAMVIPHFGDAVIQLRYDSGSSSPITNEGEIATMPLPGDPHMIRRGQLEGLVLIPANTGVHQLRFTPDSIEDLGSTSRESGLENVIGAIGVQP